MFIETSLQYIFFSFSYGTDVLSTMMYNLNCAHRSYFTILQCSFLILSSQSCTSEYDATVLCCQL